MTNSKAFDIAAHQVNLTFKFNNAVNSNSSILELGKLKLSTPNQNLLFSATSGLPGFQSLAASQIKGKGRIPSCLQAKIVSYFVQTTPVYLPNTKGVNGNFYPILPYQVNVGKFPRADLGIHRDANVPGSAGCLVITLEDHWRQFQLQMKTLADNNIVSIPLIVF